MYIHKNVYMYMHIYIHIYIHVHIQQNDFAIQQKLTQHCKSTVLQFKMSGKK